jgi:APA family basic amino acid/polyamine antiporter
LSLKVQPRYDTIPFHSIAREVALPLTRSIGRWAFTALVVNTVVGSGIFGIPSTLNGIVGRASPLAMALSGVGMGLMMACFAEVASRFTAPGGAYLYTRTAFGRFVGMQVGWFSWLAPMGTSAAAANLFTVNLAAYLPYAATMAGRAVVMTTLFLVLAIANCLGVRVGATLSNIFTVSKLLPLGLLIALGIAYFIRHPQTYSHAQAAPQGISAWVDAMLLLAFAYAGFENALLPTGEVKDPQRTVPFALGAGLLLCIAVYALVQFVVVATIGTGPVDRPLSSAALLLIGSGGAMFVTLAAMISTFGHLSAVLLATPRLTYSLAQRHDFPALFAKIHPRFQTPYISILAFTFLTWLLALSGTFRWAVALASGAVIVIYASVSASLIRLRRTRPGEALLHLPFGNVIACLCIAMAVVLLTRLTLREGFLLLVTFAVATAHWLAVRNRSEVSDSSPAEVESLS